MNGSSCLRYCCYSVAGCRSTAVEVNATGQVNFCFSYATGQLMFHLLQQVKCRLIFSCRPSAVLSYCCWSTSVSVIAACQLITEGQFIAQLLLRVNQCFCYFWRSTSTSVGSSLKNFSRGKFPSYSQYKTLSWFLLHAGYLLSLLLLPVNFYSDWLWSQLLLLQV
jgi:hypothetical protein